MQNASSGKISLIGYACDLGTSQEGTEKGPDQVINSQQMHQINHLINEYESYYPTGHATGLDALPFLHEINARIALATENLTKNKRHYVTLGGDHSSAIGTWSGASAGLAKQGELGLIWIDAHMDSHTPETTPSDNIHGMPLAVLLGFGAPSLTSLRTSTPKIKPEHVCLVGVRSFESEEKNLLEQLNVRIFYMEEIKQRGIEAVMNDALNIATTGTAGFGISLDLDAIDPIEAPGVGSPAPDGLSSKELISALKSWNNHPQLIGLEIAEFNPSLDKNHQTENIIFDVIETLFTEESL